MIMTHLLSFNVIESGLRYTVKFTQKTTREAFLPLVEIILNDFFLRPACPYYLAVSGPPGSGKSTISAVFQHFFIKKMINTFVLPLDGFHMKNEDLKKKTTYIAGNPVSLYDIKGAKETYDTENLFICMNLLKSGKNFFWPVYSRNTHNPVEKGIYVERKKAIYIIEGNYLFLDRAPWNKLNSYFNRKIFISSSEHFLKKRIIKRKKAGGFSGREALRHYKMSDRRNISEVLKCSKGYDYLLEQEKDYEYRLVHFQPVHKASYP